MRGAIALVILLLALAATAQEASLQLVGEARLKILFWSVYDSRLYTADGRYEEGQRPVRLDIEYLREVDADDLVARTAREWQRQSIPQQVKQQWLQQLAQIWPDVSTNDVLSLRVDAHQRSTFYLNGEPLGTIEESSFGQHFLGIWLSPKTSHPDLRLALIGQR